MSFKRLTLRPLAMAALLLGCGASHAALTVYTSAEAFAAATTAPGIDRYGDLATRPVDSPLVRSAGAYSYTASSDTGFYVLGSAANPYLSTNDNFDSITFGSFTPGVQGIGGNFFGTDFAGDITPGTLLLTATDNEGSFAQSIDSFSSSGFLGFVSTGSLSSLVLRVTSPGLVYPTVDNLVLAQVSTLAAVPEPESYALLLAGMGVMGLVARRRKRA